jgi:G3E family GTPase
MFWLDEGLGSTVYLDGVVTVMDASNIIKSLNDVADSSTTTQSSQNSRAPLPISTAHLQIALADVLLLNKTDLVTNEQIDEATARIRGINAIAPIYHTTYGHVDLENILDLRAYDVKSAPATLPDNRDYMLDKGIHDERIGTVRLQFGATNATQEGAIESWLQNILWENDVDGMPVEVHRVKGKFVNLHTGAVRIVQGVREVYEIVDADSRDDPDAPNPGKLVLIGKGLNKDCVDLSFKKLLFGV